MMYVYWAVVERIKDGDSIICSVDLGFDLFRNTDVRLIGVDAPETRTRDLEEKQAGLASKAWLEEMLPIGSKVILESMDYGKFGRSLGKLYLPNEDGSLGLCINDEIIRVGHATEYGK